MYMDNVDERTQWGRISRWGRQCTWIAWMKGCNGQDKQMGQTVYMDRVD
jgi:hypothetical protein